MNNIVIPFRRKLDSDKEQGKLYNSEDNMLYALVMFEDELLWEESEELPMTEVIHILTKNKRSIEGIGETVVSLAKKLKNGEMKISQLETLGKPVENYVDCKMPLGVNQRLVLTDVRNDYTTDLSKLVKMAKEYEKRLKESTDKEERVYLKGCMDAMFKVIQLPR